MDSDAAEEVAEELAPVVALLIRDLDAAGGLMALMRLLRETPQK